MVHVVSERRAIAICDRCGFRYKYASLKDDGYKPSLRVCPPCWDAMPDQQRIKIVGPDGQTLRKPRPDVPTVDPNNPTLFNGSAFMNATPVTAPAKKAVFSLFANLNSGTMDILSTQYLRIWQSSSTIRFEFKNSSGTIIAAANAPISSGWKHLAGACDLGAGAVQLYVDGVAGTATTNTNDTIQFPATCFFGQNISGGSFLNGSVMFPWFAWGQFLDLGAPANLAKFNSGGPVYLGANGEFPTGTSPTLYFKEACQNFGANYGTGGNFTVSGRILPGVYP